ncbi:helix-turn-helix domain-containing protein [Acinetobacter sp. LH3_13]|uniref:helix-turn-helix domain-containing protein n=1 Tax=Acinetobacter sp. LH3_13 TaxID=3434463 RepID=UPI003EB74974
MNKTTQDQTILNHLKSGRSITAAEAVRLYNYYRLSANIERLRKAGYDIVTHHERNSRTTGSHARYELREVEA